MKEHKTTQKNATHQEIATHNTILIILLNNDIFITKLHHNII